MVYSKARCSRIVNRSKYERADPHRRDFWKGVFTALESEAALPPDYRYEVLKETLSEKTLQDVQKILPVVEDKQRLLEMEEAQQIRVQSLSSKCTTSNKTTSAETAQSHGHIMVDMGAPVKGNIAPNLRLGVTCGDVGKPNPYTKFFKRPADRAAVWRPIPPRSLETMNLTEKAHEFTQEIAENFSEWMKSISSGGDVLQPATIMQMFDYGYKTHCATSLCVQIRELPAVPQTVADKTNAPWNSTTNALKAQIRRDIATKNRKKKVIGFGRRLPTADSYIPPRLNVKRWYQSTKRHEAIESLAPVWEGITSIRTTLAYCLYLIKNNKEFPKYLEDCKLKDRKFLEECLSSETYFLVKDESQYGFWSEERRTRRKKTSNRNLVSSDDSEETITSMQQLPMTSNYKLS